MYDTHDRSGRTQFFFPTNETEHDSVGITEDALSAFPGGASGEGIGIVKTVGTKGAEHATDRNRFFLILLLLLLLRSSNCYPLDSAKSLKKAMDKGAIIVIMRAKDQWFSRIKGLRKYKPMIAKHPRSHNLSIKNLGKKAYDELVKRLKD